MSQGDTDLLLVLLETSLPEELASVIKREELLEALVVAEGDVGKAAEALTRSCATTSSSTSSASSSTVKARSTSGTVKTKAAQSEGSKPQSKRKAETGLDDWFKNARRRVVFEGDEAINPPLIREDRDASLAPTIDNAVAGPSTTPASRPRSKRQGTPPPPLSNFLKDNSPVKTSTSAVNRLPLLMLSTPEMVARHTPTTLHPSILPAGQLLLARTPFLYRCMRLRFPLIYLDLECNRTRVPGILRDARRVQNLASTQMVHERPPRRVLAHRIFLRAVR